MGRGSVGAVASNDPLKEAGEVDTQLTRVGGDGGHEVRLVGELAISEEGAATEKQRVVLGSLEVGRVRRGRGPNRGLQVAIWGGGNGVGGLLRPEGVQGLAPTGSGSVVNDHEVDPLLRHDARGQIVRELEVNAEAFAARGCRSSQLGEGSGGDGTLGRVRGRVEKGLELLSSIEDGIVSVGAATVGKQDTALLGRVRVAQQGGGRGFTICGKTSDAGRDEDGEGDTEVG